MKKIKWALIGCGKVVLKNKTTPFINKKNTIVGICTTNINHSIKAKEKLGLKYCGCYDNYKEMLEKENIDAIYICTPPKYHYIYLNKLCKYKIPVYVEKPFVLSADEAKKIVKLYNKNNIPLFVAHYKRLTPKIKKLKKLINKNIVGNINLIEGFFHRKFNEDLIKTSWIYNKKISGGGRFFDIAPHILDVIYFIFGDFNNLKSKVDFEKKLHTCENKVNTKFKIKNINVALEFNLIANEDKDLLIIHGDKGYIKTSINREMPIFLYNKKGKLKKSFKFKKTKTWGIEAIIEIDNFIQRKNYKTDLCDGNVALKIQKYINTILKK